MEEKWQPTGASQNIFVISKLSETINFIVLISYMLIFQHRYRSNLNYNNIFVFRNVISTFQESIKAM